ncbi:MAG: hypothetical protein ACO2OX_03750 [Candidatus Nanopusillus sp.]
MKASVIVTDHKRKKYILDALNYALGYKMQLNLLYKGNCKIKFVDYLYLFIYAR